MKRSRFTEEQIIGILKEHEAGSADLCRKHGVSDARACSESTPPQVGNKSLVQVKPKEPMGCLERSEAQSYGRVTE